MLTLGLHSALALASLTLPAPSVETCVVIFEPPTPECGSTLTIGTGETLTFTVQASDSSCALPVLLEGFLLEIPGAISNPPLPVSGNPASTTITWTPTVDNIGEHNITFHALSGCCKAEAFCNLVIKVEGKPKGCTLTPGYWKTHPCNWPAPFDPGTPDPTDANGNGKADNLEGQCAQGGSSPWKDCPCDPTTTMLLGTGAYDMCELLCILDSRANGNAVRILAFQLIATKLNDLTGSSTDGAISDPDNPGNPYNGLTVSQLIAEADSLIGSSDVRTATRKSSCTGRNADPIGCAMNQIATLLDRYNNGLGTIPHCN